MIKSLVVCRQAGDRVVPVRVEGARVLEGEDLLGGQDPCELTRHGVQGLATGSVDVSGDSLNAVAKCDELPSDIGGPGAVQAHRRGLCRAHWPGFPSGHSQGLHRGLAFQQDPYREAESVHIVISRCCWAVST